MEKKEKQKRVREKRFSSFLARSIEGEALSFSNNNWVKNILDIAEFDC
jgi:hypothetical protein